MQLRISKRASVFLIILLASVGAFASSYRNTLPVAPSSSELGIATTSPSGEAGGAVVPASCPSSLHDDLTYGTFCSACSACACNYGAYQCGGVCSVGAPALPSGFGGACTSVPNVCGMTNIGTVTCSGCTAGTPSDLLCPPVVSFSINGSTGPLTVLQGTPETFSWSATNATSCVASSNDQWSGIKGTSGNATQSAVVTSDFSLSCTGMSGVTTKTVHVDVTCTPVTGAWGTCDCDTETETRTNINAACLPWTETQDCSVTEKNKCRDFNWKEVAP